MNTSSNIISRLKTDCLHYRGDRPCIPHTRSGKSCECDEYQPVTRRGVIIKLGAAGDVLRSTPLLRALASGKTGTRVLFVTHHPDLIPKEAAEAVKPDALVIERLKQCRWDFVWNLDKDLEACLLLEATNSEEKRGFGLKEGEGVPFPLDENALHKFATGVDDIYSKQNTKTYPEEIFEIVEMPYHREEYWLKEPREDDFREAERLFPGSNWIGLNTGAGWRWPTRLWSEENWSELARLLVVAGYRPIFLGGPEEEERNSRLAAVTELPSSGTLTLPVFYALVHRCRAVVTSVTQMMHLAIAAKRPLVVLNNIFNRHEFELYGRGKIIEPLTPCGCFYSPKCLNGRQCIDEIRPETVFREIHVLLR